jgi:uncharacterized protein YdcH (DUF465 family)
MEEKDREILLQVVEKDSYLKKLYQQHQKLEKEVDRMTNFAVYSPTASIRETELKKQKLRRMDEITAILRGYQKEFSEAI